MNFTMATLTRHVTQVLLVLYTQTHTRRRYNHFALTAEQRGDTWELLADIPVCL